MELCRNSWKKWGFRNNPFSSNPLNLCSDILPIAKAFVGRSMDSEASSLLLRIIGKSEGGCGIVEGDIGVGKTTLVNYHRYLWEYKAEERLMTPFREIPVYGRWNAREFLKAVLGHLAHKMLHLFKTKKIRGSQLLKKMEFLYEVFYEETTDREASALGVGISYRKNNPTNIHVPDLMEFQLIHYLEEIVREVKKIGYTGIFLHFDNLELLSREDLGKCQHLFEEIRDVMQIPDIYYIFVAKKGFYSQIVAPLERVSSIMSWPIQVPPLTCEEILQAIHTRFRLLSIKPGKEIPPVRESFIEKLYNLYQGKMRFIMDAIAQIASNFTSSARTLSDEEAEEILLEITKIKTNTLSPGEYQILLTSLQFEEFTNEKISDLLEMNKVNVSRAFKKFLEHNLIYLARRHGKKLYYKTVDNLKSLLQLNLDSLQSSSSTPEGSSPPKKSLSKAERIKKVQKHLKKHQKISRTEYERIMGVPGPTASRDLALLLKEGKLLKIGGGRSTSYLYKGEEN